MWTAPKDRNELGSDVVVGVYHRIYGPAVRRRAWSCRFEARVWLGGQQRGLLDCELLLPPASSSRDVRRNDVGLKMPRSKAARTTAREPRPTPVMTFVAGVALKTVLLS